MDARTSVAGLASLIALLVASPVAAQSPTAQSTGPSPDGQWTVAHRVPLPTIGAAPDLARLASSDGEVVRFTLSGTVSFAVDGSLIDAMSRSVSGRRDVAAGPFVFLPAGSTLIEADPVAHRYTFEAPRTASMPVAFDLMGLSTQYLLTATEASQAISGAIVLEHLRFVAPPTEAEVAVSHATSRASSVPAPAWAFGGLSALSLGFFGFVFARRRREPSRALLRRAARARAAIAKEVVALGPAFDPVTASADRLYEAATQQRTHYVALSAALERTAWTEASRRRMELSAKRAESFARLGELADRLEDTATHLAGRAADADRARGIDTILSRLDTDLGAAVEAEDELAL